MLSTLFCCFTISLVSVSRKETVKQDFIVNLLQLERGHDKELDNALNYLVFKEAHTSKESARACDASPWEGSDGQYV
jgi:hypothetical protein